MKLEKNNINDSRSEEVRNLKKEIENIFKEIDSIFVKCEDQLENAKF